MEPASAAHKPLVRRCPTCGGMYGHNLKGKECVNLYRTSFPPEVCRWISFSSVLSRCLNQASFVKRICETKCEDTDQFVDLIRNMGTHLLISSSILRLPLISSVTDLISVFADNKQPVYSAGETFVSKSLSNHMISHMINSKRKAIVYEYAAPLEPRLQ